MFHVVDHSYAQLVHELPRSRTVVSCHDLDAFRCLTHPREERRSPLFRVLARRTLSGLQKAAGVCCNSHATRTALLDSGVVDDGRVSVIPLPVHPAFSPAPDPQADAQAADLLAADVTPIDILHVGSTIRRKRIDVLLNVIARLRDQLPEVRLVRVGGPFTCDQERLIAQLNLSPHVRVLPRLQRKTVAAVYRRAALVLLTSEREGFGLPVLEALASGTPVVATDLPAVREVAGTAVSYCPVGNTRCWVDTVAGLLEERRLHSGVWVRRQQCGLAHAQGFSYHAFARRLTALYSTLS